MILGTPDFLLCVGGIFVALELKKDAKSPLSALQELNLKRIEQCGGISLVAYPENWDDIYDYLRNLAKNGDRNDRDKVRIFA